MATSPRFREPQRGPKKHRMIQNRIVKTYDYMRDRQFNGFIDWERYMRCYRGLQYSASLGRQRNPTTDQPNETIVYNEIGTIVQIMMPFLIKNMLQIHVGPDNAESIVAAILQEALANKCWKKYDMQEQLRDCALNMCITGNGFMKTVYQLDYDDTKTGYGNINYADFVTADAPYICSIFPTQLIFDMDSPHRSLDSARWCCELQYMSPGDVIGNLEYNQQDVLADIDGKRISPETVGSFIKATSYTSNKGYDNEMEDDRWILLNYWDKKYDEHLIYLKGVEDPIHMEKNPFSGVLKGFPFKHLKLIEIPNDPYGLGYPAWVEDMQYELNRHATKTYQHRRRHMGGQYNFVDMEESEIIKFQRGENISTNNPNAVVPITPSPIPPDDWRILEQTRQALRDYTPVNELAKSGMLQDRASASQANIVHGYMNVRLDYVKGKLDAFVVACVENIIELLKKYWSAEQVIEIVGAQGQFWSQVTGAQPAANGKYYASVDNSSIQGSSQVTIESTTGETYDPVVDRQQRVTVLQAAAPLQKALQAEGNPLSVSQLLKWTLEAFPSAKVDAGRFFSGMNQPVQPVGGELQQVGTQPPNQLGPQQQQLQEQTVQPASNLLGQLMGGLTVPQQ